MPDVQNKAVGNKNKAPEAALRTLTQVLNAPAQVKSASSEVDLSGGTIVRGSIGADSQDKMASVYKILGLNI